MSIVLKRAKDLAREAHKGQLYGDRDYFEAHIEVVAEETRKVLSKITTFSREDYYITLAVAYLHDIIEDCNITTKDLEDLGIPSSIIVGVADITKEKRGSRKEYLTRVAADKYATIVKLADATANMLQCRKEGDHHRAEYYQDTMYFMYKSLCDRDLL